MSFLVISSYLIASLSLGFGLFVWIKGSRKPLHSLWAFFCVCVGLWSYGLGKEVSASSLHASIAWMIVSYLGSILIPAVYLHFVMLLLNRFSKSLIVVAYGIAACLQITNFSGRLFSAAPLPPFNFYTVPRFPFYIFTLY